jgi:hypothetical protein
MDIGLNLANEDRFGNGYIPANLFLSQLDQPSATTSRSLRQRLRYNATLVKTEYPGDGGLRTARPFRLWLVGGSPERASKLVAGVRQVIERDQDVQRHVNTASALSIPRSEATGKGNQLHPEVRWQELNANG